MHTHAEKTPENNNQVVAKTLLRQQNGSESAFQFSSNNPQAIALRKLQEAANNSSHVQQLKAFGKMANSSKHVQQLQQNQATANTYTSQIVNSRESNTQHQEVVQRVFDTRVKPNALNVIGENHQKSDQRRLKEQQFATSKGLHYMLEREFDFMENGQQTMGDPTDLRILFAMASIKENVKTLELGQAANPQQSLQVITYIMVNVQNDIAQYAQQNNPLITPEFRNLRGHIRRQDIQNTYRSIENIVQIISPGNALGKSEELSNARSDSMHNAATHEKNEPVMWMVGQNHANDIDNTFPNREYTLLNGNNLDAELNRNP